MDDKEYLQRLGLKIKILRTVKKLSQDDVVNLLNIDKSYYSKLERGLTNPSLLYLRRLSDVFGIEVSELLKADMNF